MKYFKPKNFMKFYITTCTATLSSVKRRLFNDDESWRWWWCI